MGAQKGTQDKRRQNCKIPSPAVFKRFKTRKENKMILLGIVLLVLGYVLNVGILWTLGIILLVLGAILWILGSIGRPVAGRRYWY